MEFEKDVKNPPDSAEESARGKYFFRKSETEIKGLLLRKSHPKHEIVYFKNPICEL